MTAFNTEGRSERLIRAYSICSLVEAADSHKTVTEKLCNATVTGATKESYTVPLEKVQPRLWGGVGFQAGEAKP